MKSKNIYIIAILLILFLWLPLLTDAEVMNDYVIVPPFVTQPVDPNILLVLDESGSMQFPAYLGCENPFIGYDSKRARCGTSDTTTDPQYAYAYDYDSNKPYVDYYGLFDTEKYYRYLGTGKWEENTDPGCSFADGEQGLKIGDDSGNCISGNLLNWASMSRIDLLRKALVGGKSLSPQSANVHTILGEGGWRTYTDEFLGCTFSLSGGSYPTLDHQLTISDAGGSGSACTPDAVYSDDFNDGVVDAKWTDVNIGDASSGTPLSEAGGDLTVNSNGTRIWGSSDDFRYVYQSVNGDFDIRLRIMDAPNTSNSSKAALMVRETTADNSKHVMIAMRGNESRLQFSRRQTTGGNTGTFAGTTNRNTPEWVRLVRTGNNFDAYYSDNGTNWTLRASTTVTMSDPVLIGIPTSAYSSSYGNGVYDEFVYCDRSVAVGCAVGNVSNAEIKIDVPKTEKTGIIQNLSDKDLDGTYDENSPRFGVMFFAGDNRYGCMAAGIEGANLSSVVNSIQNEPPYHGTPQKYALEEAWDYYTQLNTFSNCNNSAYVQGQGMPKDPMYDDNGATPVPCRGNYVLLISDGEWNTGGDPVPTARDFHIGDIRLDLVGTQKINLYTFYIFGVEEAGGSNAMQQLAIYGGFDDNDGNTWPYDRTGYPGDSRTVTLPFGTPPNTICDPFNLPMDSGCKEWDNPPPGVPPDGIPDTYFEAKTGKEIETKLLDAISAILEKASSGTAASILSSSEGSGSNMLQAVFYPKLIRLGSEIEWTGTLQNLWYYSAPYFGASSIREDTVEDKTLHLKDDYVAQYYFDTTNQETRAKLYKDINGDGSVYSFIDDIEFENLKSLWETGLLLWQRDLSTNPRNIKTSLGSGLMDFTDPLNISTLRPYLKAADDAEAEAIIRYIQGEDTILGGGFNPPIAGFTGTYRSRTLPIDLNRDGDTADLGEEPKVWKLADIINSTPRIASWVPLNIYDEKYNDNTYAKYINTTGYKDRGVVFTGGNGGIFHAFKLGKLQLRESPDWNAGDFQQARMLNVDTDAVCDPATDAVQCGEEIWAFIPKNVLPYLRYHADIAYDHIFNIDGTPHIFDASIGEGANVVRASDGSSWRTVLIGRMNYGGACRAAGSGCANCVEAPGVDLNGDGDTNDPGEGTVGMSSFFAIDITDLDPDNWTLLWEFSHEELGFSTAAPAVVRISSKDVSGAPEVNTNGNWYVVLGSGPTGPIDTTEHQFMGRSDQNLKLFVLDLRTGNLLSTIDTGITNAFAGSMVTSTVDPDLDYQDDAFYLGYTNSATGVGNSFTDGGVLRVLTNEDDSPGNWVVSKVMENIGTVTASVDRLEDTISGKLWLYFGTGRYFYKLTNATDDPTNQRTIYGIKEPCYSGGAFKSISDCASESMVTMTDLQDATSDANLTEDVMKKGWYIDLDAQNTPVAGDDAERVITNPVASTSKVVYFTTVKPTADICGAGGTTHLWGVKYETGGSASVAGLTKGTALLQVSTGQIKELKLKEIFEQGTAPENKDKRRSFRIQGLAPVGSGLLIVTQPPPLENIIHIMER